MRIIGIVPILIGILLGFVTPVTDAATSLIKYEVRMFPASGTQGETVRLNCGFHGGSCLVGASGDHLDWDNTSSKTVYFRGLFKRDKSVSGSDLYATRHSISSGANNCDRQEVRVFDKKNVLRFKMNFTHLSMNNTNQFSISASATDGTFNTKSLGTMIDDAGTNCPWGGYHVHAGRTAGGDASYSKNSSKYPNGDYCPGNSPASCYQTVNNNVASSWAQKFTWSRN